jgi:hypothetical protein
MVINFLEQIYRRAGCWQQSEQTNEVSAQSDVRFLIVCIARLVRGSGRKSTLIANFDRGAPRNTDSHLSWRARCTVVLVVKSLCALQISIGVHPAIQIHISFGRAECTNSSCYEQCRTDYVTTLARLICSV